MGLEKLNPFKKHYSAEKDTLAPPKQDGLAPTKSTSSVAASIRSLGDKAEKFFAEDRPTGVYKDKTGETYQNTIPPLLSTSGPGNGLAPALSNPGLR